MTTAAVRPLTTRTRIALSIARALAAARGERDLTPTHIALGIFREGANPALAVLFNCGVAPNVLQRITADFESRLGEPPGKSAPRQVALDLTPGESHAISLGEMEAQRLNDDYVGTEHILLGLLRDSTAEPAQVLAQHGVSASVVESGILSLRSS